jgi:hypothetical protein
VVEINRSINQLIEGVVVLFEVVVGVRIRSDQALREWIIIVGVLRIEGWSGRGKE